MMDGRYRIGTEQIRSQAVMCHALDTQFASLFNADTICDKSPALVESCERLFASTLLNLAILIRVSFNLEPEYTSLTSGIQASGLFEKGAPRKGGGFSVKDVCDKIIHADQIFKPEEPGVRGAGCTIRGSHHGNPREFVLAWLDRIDAVG